MVAEVVGKPGHEDTGPWRGGGQMFLGTYTPKLDDKGRLTLPAKFRDALAGGLMVTKSQDHSLAVYPRTEFEQLARRASKASRSNPDARAFLRNLAAATDEQHPDAQGRITLSDRKSTRLNSSHLKLPRMPSSA